MNTNNKHYRVQLRSMKLINSKEQLTGGLQQQCSKLTISLQGPGKRLSWSTEKLSVWASMCYIHVAKWFSQVGLYLF